MNERTARLVAGSTAVVTLVLVAVALVLLVSNAAAAQGQSLGTNGVGVFVFGITYPLVGWLIATRRRENAIGWIFLFAGLAEALEAFCFHYAMYGLFTAPGSLAFADLASWVQAWVWVPGVVLLFLLVLVFPDGRLPSRRWRPVLWLGLVAFILQLGPNAIALWPYRGLWPGAMPDPASSGSPVIQLTLGAGGLASLGFALAAGVAVVVRFRRSVGVERQQIKWFAWAGGATIALLWITTGWPLQPPLDILAAIVIFPLLPLAMTVAILRYRLYEIDRIISRVIGYTVVTGVLALVFVGGILAFQAVLSPMFGENPVAVAASTLIVAALFQPLRTRVQRAVDRRFNRARYDAERTVAAFSVRLRDEVELASLDAEIGAVVRETLAPASLGLWLHSLGVGE